MAFWKNEKRVLGPLAAKENAPYRNCGGRFSRVAGWRGVFAQSGKAADTALSSRGRNIYDTALNLSGRTYEERQITSRTPSRQRKRTISKLWRSFFQGRRLARSFRTVCHVGGYTRLRMLAYYCSCGQSHDYPEGQIYQQQVERK